MGDGKVAAADRVLVDAMCAALEATPEGLTEREIRRTVIESSGVRCNPVEVRNALDRHPDLFVALAGGVWRLRAVVQSEEIALGEPTDLRRERGREETPFLAALPALDRCVMFDLETTGTRADRDQIIQIAAVRMVQGAPEAAFNQYVRLEGREIPYGLRVKLGFTKHPEWETALQQAEPMDAVLTAFREWSGGLPLVAHNARFDLGFLKAAGTRIGWQVENPVVDTMELAMLCRPDVGHYRLEELAKLLGVCQGQAGGTQVEGWAAQLAVEGFSWTDFHNAIVDVLVLAAMTPRLVDGVRQWTAQHPGLAGEFWRLMPKTAARLGIPQAAPAAERDAAVRDLARSEPAPATRLPLMAYPFSPERIREQLEEIADRHPTELKRREAQVLMAEQVSRALAGDRFTAIEAPTGTGKTFAYLVPGVLWARSRGEPVVVSTHTKLLQDQMNDDLKRVERYLGAPFRAQVLKGMNNYVCLERAAAVYAQTTIEALDQEERFAWLVTLFWLSGTRDGLLGEVNFWYRERFPALDRLLEGLQAEKGECSHERCAQCGACYHRLAYERAQTADVVVMNHALLLAKEWERAGLPFTRVVVDEGHSLEDAATDAATEEVTRETVTYLANRLLDYRTGQGVLVRLRDKVRDAAGQRLIAVVIYERNSLAALVEDFGEQLRRYVELNQTQVDPRYGAKLMLEADPRLANPTSWAPMERARERLGLTLNQASSAVERLSEWLAENELPAFQRETQNELWYLRQRLAEEADKLGRLLRVGYDRLVRVSWVEVSRAKPLEPGQEDAPYDGPYKWAVKQAPVRVGPYLNDVLYTGKLTLVVTSATLRTTQEAGFGFVLGRLGLTEKVAGEDAVVLPAELDYSRALFAVARYLRADARPSEVQNFVDEVGQELGWFFRFTGGNGLGLFTARERMTKVYRALEPILSEHSIPLGCQGETGSPKAVLEELQTRPGSVVLGLKTYWQGVDVRGPNLSYVVMEKLPFPMLGEPLIRARTAEVRANGGHEFSDYVLPLMLIEFKQGFGRLIRDERDIGAVLLLDKRAWNREYWRDVIAALPGNDGAAAPGGPGRAPVVIRDERLLSRRKVYEAIGEHMRNAPPEWQIDWDRLLAILELLPEELLTGLERLLAELGVPDVTPLEQWLLIRDRVMEAVRRLFSFDGWKIPEQEEVVKALLTGQDALVVLPTGSGKSFTFQLPALLRDGTTLVFSPLKALMKDQVDKLLDRGLAVADRVDSSQSAEEQERVYQRMREGTTRLVYVAPERIRDPKLMAALRSAKNIVQVVVDEAHCVHMWGQSFRPDFLHIAALVDAIAAAKGKRPPVAALTATATPRVREAIAQRLRLREGYAQIDSNPNRPELRLVVYNRNSPGLAIRSPRDKMRILMRILRTADRNDESAIVYVNTTREAERLSRRLEARGLEARFYHGKMDDQARKDVQDMFLDGQVKVIVATKAFGMGIDKPDIRYVIHYQMPADVESYYQEAGRAGRDGKVSWAVLLFHEDDLWVHENFFIPKSLPEPEQVANVLGWVRRRCEEAGWGEIYVDPREMADALDFDEDRELGIHLHLLEEMGYLHRGTDVTLKASARLLAPLGTVMAQAEALAPGPAGKAAGQVLTKQGINEVTRGEINTVDGALVEGVAPAAVDDVLYQLALRGSLIYRAYARAFTLEPGPKLRAGTPLKMDMKRVAQVQGEMRANLAIMRRYGESLQAGDCLRAEVLGYLGAKKPATRRDACCSLCDVNLRVPWTEEPMWEDFSDPGRYLDAKFMALKAAGWNAGLAETRGRAPYGAKTLAYVLLGNDYMATRWVDDPGRRAGKRQAILGSEYYGVLEGVKGGSDAVLDVLDDLRQEGYLTEEERTWEGGGYRYPAPTELGWERLGEGRLFGDEGDTGTG